MSKAELTNKDFVKPNSKKDDVDVIHGVYAHSLPLAGVTVRQVRSELGERLNMDPEAMVYVDGEEADEDTVLAGGQVLTFVKHAGEMGA